MNLFLILDTLLNKHAYLLMVIIDVVMFEYFTFCIVADNFKEFLCLSSQLFVDFFHDFDINMVGGHLNV